jgi:tetratricopeptide (TPR) repeat protein
MLRGLCACDFYERGLALKKVQIFDMAITEFREATKDPEQAGKAFAQMALCFKRLGQDEKAVTAFREALATESFPRIERVHIQYLLAQTLESLNRDSEALVIYRRIRREFPTFQDVDERIQNLSSHKLNSRYPVAAHESGDLNKLWSHVKPQLTSFLNQTWQRLAHHGDAPRSIANMTVSDQKSEAPARRCRTSAPRLN